MHESPRGLSADRGISMTLDPVERKVSRVATGWRGVWQLMMQLMLINHYVIMPRHVATANGGGGILAGEGEGVS